MNQSLINQLRLKVDDWRVRQHFKRVEIILRDRDVSHLSPNLQLNRKKYLDALHNYAARAVFPRNYKITGSSPCFIDREGRECAVAHLIQVSGHAELANHIAATTNYAYVREMTFPELDKWAGEAGLTRAELTLIQPAYYSTFSGELLLMAIAGWVIGSAAFLVNAEYIVRKRQGVITPVLGLIAALVLVLIGIFCLDS